MKLFTEAASTILRMDPLVPMMWLCAAVLAVAASALSAFERAHRSCRGFHWWTGALWLNAAGACLIALLDSTQGAPPLLQWVFVPWPLLSLLGLRRFHARVGQIGRAHV